MIAAAVWNHLWQSTLFALCAALLTLAFRRNHAQVRYGIWLAASVKFLLPFSLLVALGNRLGWFAGTRTGAGTLLHFAIEVVADATPAVFFPRLQHLLAVLAAAWFCGFALVLTRWFGQWRRARAAVRCAVPLHAGREVESLRRMQRRLGARPIALLQSHSCLEPGVFGIVNSVMLWPAGISERLDDAQLEAVLAHEVRHVLRYDNLAAAVHMVVEALFWFHPMVWWLGTRLVEERERACDEDVLEFGSDRQAYAESILKVCEFCLASPLECMSGVAGGDLKKRMVYIMTERRLRKLEFGKRFLLGAAGVAAVAVPFAFGLVGAVPGRVAEATITVAQDSGDAARAHASRHEMSALIVKKVQPVYPEAAKKAHIQGEVVLRAIIGKEGDVENLQVVSGPAELAPAAIDAVKQWKYRPYMKDGQAVEVETEISVNFTLMK
jgi:bla regulator protein blaR1